MTDYNKEKPNNEAGESLATYEATPGGNTMSAYESTQQMLQKLSEEDLVKVKAYISRLFSKQNAETAATEGGFNPYKPLTREEIWDRLEHARKQVEEGKTMDALQAAKNVREKYGL